MIESSKSFRDELLVTSVVAGLLVVGSFYIVSRTLGDGSSEKPETEQVLGTENASGQLADGESVESVPTAIPAPSASLRPVTPAPSATASSFPRPSPTVNPGTVEVPFGASQTFENDDYKLSFTEPRLVSATSTVFLVKTVLANKSVEGEGLENKLFGRIANGAVVVTENAPMNISEKKRVRVGEQITFTASLGLVDGTAITAVVFRPGENLTDTTYTVGP